MVRTASALAAGLMLALSGGSGARSAADDLDPDWIRAMVRVEAGDNHEAYASDPLQVNRPGDWSAYKGEIGLAPGVAPGAGASITAGLALLSAHAWQVDADGHRVAFRGWKEATRRYNGGGDPNYLAKVEAAYQDIKAGR